MTKKIKVPKKLKSLGFLPECSSSTKNKSNKKLHQEKNKKKSTRVPNLKGETVDLVNSNPSNPNKEYNYKNFKKDNNNNKRLIRKYIITRQKNKS